MTRPIAFGCVLLAFALAPGLLAACADNSGERVSWAGKDIYIPPGYELGETGSGRQRSLEDGQHAEGPLFTWVEVVRTGTGDVVGLLICEQFSCERSPLSYLVGDNPTHEQVLRQIAESARGPFDDCDPRKEPCEGE